MYAENSCIRALYSPFHPDKQNIITQPHPPSYTLLTEAKNLSLKAE